MNTRLSMLIGLFVFAGCGEDRVLSPGNATPASNTQSERMEPDDPDVVASVERMLTTHSTEAQVWVASQKPTRGPGIKRIYDTGVKKIVIHEYDEEGIGRVPKAIIIDRGHIDSATVQRALSDLLTEQQIRDHGQTLTSRYTVLLLY